MSDYREEIESRRGGLKQLLSKIPGFKGYIEQEDRRTADKILRETVANRYNELLDWLFAIQREYVDQGDLEIQDDLESVGVKLRTFIDRIRRASYGYSSFFDAMNIDQERLDELYEYDNALLDGVEQFKEILGALEEAEEEEVMQRRVKELDRLARKTVQWADRRKEVILGDSEIEEEENT